MGRALVLIDNGFQEAELLYPYYRLQEAGYTVDLVGPKAGENYVGDHGYGMNADLSPEDVNIGDYDVVVIPGGRAPDRMRTKETMVDLVKEAHEKDKVIAAICHGPQMLIEADVVRGKTVTSYAAVETDQKNAGAAFENRSVVVDGNLVTSRVPGDLPDFCRETLKLLEK
ncbi:MAG: type 1 glutamine amidotransferase [Candidatus Bathyarchaeota archaeon]|nr:type 1 glutamine amidotransferase [Candidatus Bathyarchaeota archaeon]